jgi:chromosome partitioning protein
MKTISIVHKKGGAGKTTLAYMLASGALNLGLKVHLIDGDRNLQLANWKHRFEEYNWEIERPQWPHNLTHENLHGSIDGLYEALDKAERNGIDLTIIDTRPGSNEDTEDIAYAADLILIPLRANPADYELAKSTYDWMIALRSSFPDMEQYPEIRMVLSDASKGIIDAMAPESDVSKITKSEYFVLSQLMDMPFLDTPIPASKVCEQLPFFGPLGPAAEAHEKNKGTKLQSKSISKILEFATGLSKETLRTGASY